MNIVTSELTGKTSRLLTTEIMFFIVSARSMNKELLKLKIKKEENESVSEKEIAAISKILKSVKRKNLIQFFVASTDFGAQSTEIEYLMNKYPTLVKEQVDEVYFIVKI